MEFRVLKKEKMNTGVKEKLIGFVKHIVFKVSCPIYLWSIGMKNLEQYWNEIYKQEGKDK